MRASHTLPQRLIAERGIPEVGVTELLQIRRIVGSGNVPEISTFYNNREVSDRTGGHGGFVCEPALMRAMPWREHEMVSCCSWERGVGNRWARW